MIELYFAPTPNAQRALIALEEAGLEYVLHNVDLLKGEQKEKRFLSINPLGAVPVLVDRNGPQGDPLLITQSICIIYYIGEKAGALIPTERLRRIEMLKWMMLAASDVAGTNTAINQLQRSAPDKSAANIKFFEHRLLNYLNACDERLATRHYFADELSLADISLYPFAHARFDWIQRQNGLGHLREWFTRLSQRPAIIRAMAPKG